MYNFCTLFDSYYIHKGLALYESLCNVQCDFHLYIVAFDDASYTKLSALKLKHATIISLDEFESPDLLKVKPTRNKAEYCWTCSPAVTLYCMDRYNLESITYVDADLMFLNSPKPLFDEIGDKPIAITEHFNDDPSAGRYCVQFMYFRNNEEGRAALTWWRDKCLEWCYARYEDGKFGDQAYIEAFPERYPNVCVLQHRGGGLADWNVGKYTLLDDYKFSFGNDIFDSIFFHFHGTSINLIDHELVLNIHTSDLSKNVINRYYIPYLELMRYVYEKYLGNKVDNYRVIERSQFQKVLGKIRAKFRQNKLARFVYYKIFNVKYNGYEQQKN